MAGNNFLMGIREDGGPIKPCLHDFFYSGLPIVMASTLIQMEIGGHSPIPLAQNNCPLWQFPSYFYTVFQVPNFRGCFEALNDVFW